jgi:hypothetical protein
MWRDLAIGLSLANISFLRVWSDLLTYTVYATFWMKHPPTPTEIEATAVNVLVIGCALGLGVNYVRRNFGERGMIWVRRLFLASLILPINAIRTVIANQLPLLDYLRSGLFDVLGQPGVVYLAIGLCVAGLVLITFWAKPLSKVAGGAFLAFFPFLPIILIQAVMGITRYNPEPYRDKPVAAALPVKDGARRAVWIVFDETDYRLAFVDRDPTLQLPEFDRLRNESIFATHAQPPGPQTPISMPGYVTGRLISGTEPSRQDELMISYAGTEEGDAWSKAPNVFRKARQAGLNTSVVGWYHPYCRIINSDLTSCEWWPMAMQYNSMGDTFAELIPNQARSVLETSLFSVFGQSLSAKQHIQTYHEMLARSKQVVADKSIGLTLLHLPVPHAPHVYDRKTGQFTRKNSAINAYVDSLALMDRTLGELRHTMESAGTWENTTLVVSSDHGYREAQVLDGKKDSRIPFLLKLAGQKEGLAYDSNFNTVVTGDLLLSILRGELTSPDAVCHWLDGDRSHPAKP